MKSAVYLGWTLVVLCIKKLSLEQLRPIRLRRSEPVRNPWRRTHQSKIPKAPFGGSLKPGLLSTGFFIDLK